MSDMHVHPKEVWINRKNLLSAKYQGSVAE